MGCIHTSNSNKSRITIRVMELKYYIAMFNKPVICRVPGLEAIRHLRVRGLEAIRHLPSSRWNNHQPQTVMPKCEESVMRSIHSFDEL